jgi:hypothetical protein
MLFQDLEGCGFKTQNTLQDVYKITFEREKAAALRNSAESDALNTAQQLEIAKKTNRLRDFQADFEIIIYKEYPDFDYYNDNPDLLSELKKYNYYYQEFLSLQNK